ncbi:MAG TPA: hypothetical protein VFT74_21400 [Isosphaeraceae bacterium]|nr:hypothetical protein [Isosphaeraceae bacterium]
MLTRDEVRAVLAHLTGEKWLIASLLYGSGLGSGKGDRHPARDRFPRSREG